MLLADALTSVAVLLRGAAIVLWGWKIVDPILTITIAAYVIIHASTMFRRTASILMNGSPADTDAEALIPNLQAVAGVIDVHHVHVWELDEHERAMEAHVVIDCSRAGDLESIKKALKRQLREQFAIEHCTLEFELADETGRSNCTDTGTVPQH